MNSCLERMKEIMKYKREEYFRYTFEEPIIAHFNISQINNLKVTTSKGEASVIDLSPSGLRLSTPLEISQANHQSIHLTISFQLNEEVFEVNGEIIWMEDKIKSYHYGIELFTDDTLEQELINQLKIYAKNIHPFN